MRSRHRVGETVILTLVVSLTGCSFIFNHGAPADADDAEYFDCNSSAAAPATDLLQAALYGISAVALLGDTDGDGNGAAAVSGGLAALFGASGVFGLVQRADCADAKADLRRRIYERSQRVNAERAVLHDRHRRLQWQVRALQAQVAGRAPNLTAPTGGTAADGNPAMEVGTVPTGTPDSTATTAAGPSATDPSATDPNTAGPNGSTAAPPVAPDGATPPASSPIPPASTP